MPPETGLESLVQRQPKASQSPQRGREGANTSALITAKGLSWLCVGLSEFGNLFRLYQEQEHEDLFLELDGVPMSHRQRQGRPKMCRA